MFSDLAALPLLGQADLAGQAAQSGRTFGHVVFQALVHGQERRIVLPVLEERLQQVGQRTDEVALLLQERALVQIGLLAGEDHFHRSEAAVAQLEVLALAPGGRPVTLRRPGAPVEGDASLGAVGVLPGLRQQTDDLGQHLVQRSPPVLKQTGRTVQGRQLLDAFLESRLQGISQDRAFRTKSHLSVSSDRRTRLIHGGGAHKTAVRKSLKPAGGIPECIPGTTSLRP